MVTERFIEAVESNNEITIRVILKNSLVVDPTFKEFDELCSYVNEHLTDLFDQHDGEVFLNDSKSWNKEYMDVQMNKLIDNFSKERIALLRVICAFLFKERANQIQAERFRREQEARPRVIPKQIGVGVSVAGVGMVIAGLIASKTILTIAGVACVVVGGIVAVTSKAEK